MDSHSEQHVIPPVSPPPLAAFDDSSDVALSEEECEGKEWVDVG